MHRTQTLRRLGVAGLGAATLLSTPWIGAIGTAIAAPATLQIVSQQTGTGSTRNDGTNTTVKISAVVTTVPSGTGNPDVASVRFSYTTPANSTPVIIGTDSTAPYSVPWAPPSPGDYTVLAEPLAAGGGSAGSSDTQAVTVGDFSSVHISSPAEGAAIGSFDGFIIVSGTRSSDLPAISVTSQTRNNATGALSASGTPGTVVAGTPAAGADQTWSVRVPVPACGAPANSSCDVVITATATGGVGNGTSDEVTQAGPLYTQTLSNFTVAPSSATSPTNNDVKYTATATDQSGKPIAGLVVTATPDADSDATIDSPQTTGTDGKAVFTASDGTPETTTFTFETHVNGDPESAPDPQQDFTRTATLMTYTPVASGVTITKTPSFPVYTSGHEYNADFPLIEACFTDQNGNALTGAASPIVNVTRHIDGESPDTNPAGSASPEGADDPGCFQITVSPYPTAGQEGNDVYTVYLEKNGTPGFQSGADVGGTTTVNFANSEITFDNCSTSSCATQAQVGTVKTLTAHETTGGQPRAGRTLTFTSFGGATFPATQPSGATRENDTTATCVTNASGSCSVNVTDASTGEDEIDVSDDTQPNDDPGTGASASTTVDFRTNPTTLSQSDTNNNTNSGVVEAVSLYPGSNREDETAIPGVIVATTWRLFDQNGESLRNVAATVHLDHGYFTECPGTSESETYEDCSFTPAPADGQQVGAPVNDGQTQTFQTDNNGFFETYISIGRDAAFDQDGFVDTHPTVTVGGVTIDLGNPSDFFGNYENGDHPTFVTDTREWEVSDGPLNGTTVQILPGTPGQDLSDNTADDLSFYVVTKDQFGNLVRDDNDLTVHVSGPGEADDQAFGDGFAKDIRVLSSFTDPDNRDLIFLDNESSSFTAQNVVVTATWVANVTTWDITQDAVTGDDIINTNQDTTQKSDSFTAHFYEVNLQNLHYKYSLKPARIVRVQTTVSNQVTVTDQYNNPVRFLEVDFHQSGPGPQVDNSDCHQTNADGKATYSFSSSTQGNATLTAIVTDQTDGCSVGGSGNELSRSTRHIGFDGVPSIHVSETHFNKPGHTVDVFGHTRAGALVQLYKKVAGTRHYVLVKSKHANANGNYSFTRTVNKTQRFLVRVDHLVNSTSRKVTVG